jgi:hypothetical protein
LCIAPDFGLINRQNHIIRNLTFICLRILHYRMTLRTAPSDRDVRTRSTAFRVDLGTRYITICVVSRLLQEGVGEARIVVGVGKQ